MNEQLTPSLRGVMGDWVYYVTLMRLRDVASRIQFAHEIHSNQSLNDLIQRRLDEGRGKKIAEYLRREEQRFFNAMVVGVYKGDPCWYDFAEINPQEPGQFTLPDDAPNSLGFLGFTGEERLFALDGQHRLSGIKQAVDDPDSDLAMDQIAVIFVAHQKGEEGMQRTRRLFTILNKTARPVLKGDIIALDEDDVMAICTRRLLDNSEFFSRGQVAMRLQNSLPPSDKSSWTTVSMLYDVLKIAFFDIYHRQLRDERIKLEQLKQVRPENDVLNAYYAFALQFFELMSEAFVEVSAVLKGKEPTNAVKKYRTEDGGSVLYRPLGQKIFAQVAYSLCKNYSLEEAFQRMSNLPTSLDGPPYADVIWDTGRHTMASGGPAASLVKDLLLYMLREGTRLPESTLLERYAQYLNQPVDDVTLPAYVVD